MNQKENNIRVAFDKIAPQDVQCSSKSLPSNCDNNILDNTATIRYTTKYVSKAEKSSKQLLRALEKMVRCSEESDTIPCKVAFDDFQSARGLEDGLQ